MFIGHFAVGMALKKADRALSLGFLFIGAQLSDLIYGFNLLTRVEKVSLVAGTNPLTSADYIFFPYSHSLVATLVWTGLIALIFLIAPIKSSLPKKKTAIVMAIAVLSHFVLDVIVHNPDMDLLGNGAYKIGLGLWNYPFASYGIEAFLMVIGLWIYLRSTKSKGLSGNLGIPLLSAILLILNAVSTFGAPETNVEYFVATMIAIYLGTIAAAFWLDRNRD